VGSGYGNESSAVTVQVACVPDLRVQRLQSFLGALYARSPRLAVEVVHLDTAEQLSRLRSGAVDMGLLHAAFAQDSVELIPVFPGEPLALFLPPGHRLCESEIVAPGDVSEEVLLVPQGASGPGLHDSLVTRLGQAGYHFRDVRETSGAGVRDVLFAVAGARGVGVASVSIPSVVGELGDAVVRKPLDPAARMPDTALAWAARPASGLEEVIATARAAAAELRRLHAG
jgi:hypothetical protein